MFYVLILCNFTKYCHFLNMNKTPQSNRHDLSSSDKAWHLLAATQIPMLLLDHQLKLLYYTPKLMEIVNLLEMDNAFTLDVLASRLGYAHLIQDAQSVLSEGMPVEQEVQDKSKRCYLTKLLPYQNPESKSMGVMITFVDISAQKQAEQALREREAQYHTALKNSPVVFAQIGKDLRYEWIFNPHPDFVPSSVIGYRDDELDTGPGIDAIISLKQKAFEQGKQLREEITFFRSDGDHTYDMTATPVRNEQGQIQSLITASLDITVQRQIKEALKRSEQNAQFRLDELEAIYTSAPVGLCVIDTQLRYVRINKLLAEINGYTVEQHIGKSIREILPSLAHEVEAIMHEIIENDEPVLGIELNGETIAQPGVQRSWVESWLPFKNQQGVVMGINIVAQEVTEQKQKEAELQKYQEDLAAMNEELTVSNEELRTTNEDLLKTNERLKQVNNDLDNFVYAASHDLKTPIANIHGLMKVLRLSLPAESLSSDRIKKTLRMMEESVDRFMKTISDLSDIVRLQKQADLPVEQVNVSEIIREAQLDLALFIEQTNTELTINVNSCKPIPFVPKNLRSVVYNLISNAIKYRDPRRTPQIHIECKEEEGYQVLTVTDNGLGMDLRKTKSRIFGMFKRMHDHVEGSGVGLYMVKKIVENAGGKIEVESQLGKGSSFKVYFPHQ